MDNVKKAIGDVLEALDGFDIDLQAEMVIKAIGLEEDPNVGPSNEMIRFQTKWFDR